MTCSIESCTRPAYARGLCQPDYDRARYAGTLHEHPLVHDAWKNPLVCVCDVPDADPLRDYGMCRVCKRIPLALFKTADAKCGAA